MVNIKSGKRLYYGSIRRKAVKPTISSHDFRNGEYYFNSWNIREAG